MAKKKRESVKYTTYFFSEQDPALPFLLSIRNSKGAKDGELFESTKVSKSTMRNWWSKTAKKPTKRPQLATVAAVAVGLGLDSLPLTPEARRKARGG